MKLQRAPLSHTCLATAFAMVLGVDALDLINSIGRNPHEVLWPQLIEPQCYRGHHIQEMIDYAWTKGHTVTEIQAMPRFGTLGCTETFGLYHSKFAMPRIAEYMRLCNGVITSPTHAVAWCSDMVYDPNGTMYPIEELIDPIQSFYAVVRAS